MIQIDVQKLEEKIHIEYHMSMEAAHERTLQVEKRCPKQLYINVYQWIKGDEISDIYIGKYSLPMILDIWKSNDFLRALEVMCELSQGDTEKAELKIWEMRRKRVWNMAFILPDIQGSVMSSSIQCIGKQPIRSLKRKKSLSLFRKL